MALCFKYLRWRCLFFQKLKLESHLSSRTIITSKPLPNFNKWRINTSPNWNKQVSSIVCFNFNIEWNNNLMVSNARYKSSKSKSKKESEETDSDTDDEDISDDEDHWSSVAEEEASVPNTYKEMKLHSLRADHIVNKGLGLGSKETETLFYSSKFLHNGKTLLKKSKKLNAGDYIDVTSGEAENKSVLMVRRVKIVKILKQLTRSGKPIVLARCWRKPFAIEQTKTKS